MINCGGNPLLGGEVCLVNDVLVVKAKTLLDHQVLHPAGEAASLACAGIPATVSVMCTLTMSKSE